MVSTPFFLLLPVPVSPSFSLIPSLERIREQTESVQKAWRKLIAANKELTDDAEDVIEVYSSLLARFKFSPEMDILALAQLRVRPLNMSNLVIKRSKLVKLDGSENASSVPSLTRSDPTCRSFHFIENLNS